MKLKLLSLIDRISIHCLLSVLLLTGCSGSGGSAANAPESSSKNRNLAPIAALSTEISVVNGLNDLGLGLLGKISGNAVVAPFSASLTLARLRAGAKGETLAAINEVLHLPGSGEEVNSAFNDLDLKINQTTTAGGWTQAGYGYLLTYLDTLAENYGLKPARLDFALAPTNASQAVSDWALQASGGLSTAVSTTNATRLVLGDAFKLNAAWANQFDPALTETSGFQPLNAATVNVPFMHMSAVLPVASGNGYIAVALDLSGGRQFLVLLPDEGRFTEIQSALTEERLQQISAALSPTQVDLALPRFSIESSTTLNPGTASGPGVADFSGIDGTGDLYVSATVHHSRLSVTETGLLGGSVTLLSLEDVYPETWTDPGSSGYSDYFSFDSQTSFIPGITVILGRPFIFTIRDSASGAILLMGRVMEPSI